MSSQPVGQVELHVIHEGQGAPILFVHGFPLSGAMWKYQRTEFRTTHQVVIPDLRGFGQSAAAKQADSLQDYADDLARVLDGLKISEPVVLCGLSMGGYIAFRFWEKYAGRVRALILCDTKAAADVPEAAQARRDMADRVLKEGTRIAADAMLPKLFDSATSRAEIDETQEIMLATPPETIAAAQRAMAARPDSTPLLKTIDVPALVIAGAEDRIIKPDDMRAMSAALPQGEFAQIPLAGHMAPLEQPHAVNAAIRRFLASL